MAWPENPSCVEELPVTGFNRYIFSVMSSQTELALCDLVTANRIELEEMTQGDAALEQSVADRLIVAAVDGQYASAMREEDVLI
jgi:hypothetical protein